MSIADTRRKQSLKSIKPQSSASTVSLVWIPESDQSARRSRPATWAAAPSPGDGFVPESELPVFEKGVEGQAEGDL